MKTFAAMHRFLYLYNGIVVMLFAAFFYVTQRKIASFGAAHEFLAQDVPTIPMPAENGFLSVVFALALIFVFSHLYADDTLNELWRYLLIFLEIIACVLVMHSINMAYDGVILLVVVDLMRRYEGRHQEYILLFSMVGLYLLANYNLTLFRFSVVPFEDYLFYYTPTVQTFLSGLRNFFSSLNITFFVIAMVLLVKSNHEEKERIRQLNEALRDANHRLAADANDAARAGGLRERNRLAREIHDTLGHTLTGLVAGLDAAIMTLDTSPDFAKRQLVKLRQTAQNGIVEVRQSVNKLRPDALSKLPFRYALAKTCADFADNSGMMITFDVANWPENLRQDEEDTIYRIVQESLTNANRHGRAKHVGITIGVIDNYLHIIIADDGTGCSTIMPGFGLTHMKERLAILGGTLKFRSVNGFVVEATLPTTSVRQ